MAWGLPNLATDAARSLHGSLQTAVEAPLKSCSDLKDCPRRAMPSTRHIPVRLGGPGSTDPSSAQHEVAFISHFKLVKTATCQDPLPESSFCPPGGYDPK